MNRKNIFQLTVAAGLLSASVHAGSISLMDSAFVRSGTNAATAQDWSSRLELKNAGGNFCRIALMKADLSSITGTVDSATFSCYAKDPYAHTLYIYGVKDSADFENWIGDAAGNATWNSVSANSLFDPVQDLYLIGHTNLVLLGSQALSGSNTGDVNVVVSGANLVNLLNNDTDGLLSFVFAVAENASNLGVRPHNHANAPSLEFSYAGGPAPFPYPLYGEAAQLYSNSAPYDLTQETYTFSTLWSTPAQADMNFLSQSYHSPIVTRGSDTFVLYVDTDHRLKAAHLTNGVFKTEAFVDNTLYQSDEFYNGNGGVPGYHTFRFEDGHHAASLGIDEKGYLHIVGDMHNYPRYDTPMDHLPLRYFDKEILYWRSDNPLDVSSFSFKGDQAGPCPPGFGFTYQFFFNDLNGQLHFTARAHQAEDNALRCVPFSSYDADTGTWASIGGPDPDDPGSAPRTFYDDGREYDASNPNNKYSKTHPHGVFDRQNNMHLVAPMLSDPTEHPGPPDFYHFADTIMYVQSSNGMDYVKADGTPVTLPATINLTTNQADIAYSTSGYLAVEGNITVDYQNNPYTIAKHKYTDSTPSDTIIVGWNGTAWINYGEMVSSASDYRLVHDPAGVMSYIPDSDSRFYRFWHPTDSLHEVNTPWSIRVIDYEYLKKTGNILGLSKIDNKLTVVKVEIGNRPGMELIDPPAETVTNHPPVITSPASAAGSDLSVAAADADGDPLTYTWSKSYGPGEVYFSINGTAASSNTTMSVSEVGTYEFKVVVSDGTDERVSTCYVLVTEAIDPATIFQIGGLLAERDAAWSGFTAGISTGTYTFADSTDPALQFTVTAAAGHGDVLSLNSGFIGIDSSWRQTDDNTGRISLDEFVTITVSCVDPNDSLAELKVDGFGAYWGNNSVETTVFTDASANSTNIVAFDHTIPDRLIDYAATGLDPLNKYNTGFWSMTVSADHSLGATSTGLGGFILAYRVDAGGDNTVPYDAWAGGHGLVAGVNDGYGDDAEYGGLGDGMNNLFEYALGGNPTVDDAAVMLPGHSLDGSYLNYVYRRRTDAAARGLSYDVLNAANLVSGTWTNTSEEAGSAVIDADFESVTNRVPTATEVQQFMKLKIGINE